MKAERLAGLEPQSVFAYFEKLCSIPHGSRNTKRISDYFVSFAQEHGLRCIQDESNNVIIFKDGSAGYEDHEPLILQGHMDMVCQKDEGSTIDMEKDPLDVTHDGKYIFARGTSLGGDDGAAVALSLAILADDSIAHPPLEVIFTSDEEIGLVGANAIDLSMLKGRRMLNMDTLHDVMFTAGCSGGARVSIDLPVKKTACKGTCVRLTMEDFHGGHSGGLIKCNYANTNKVMGQLLQLLRQHMPVQIISFAGGTAGNAIPRSCQSVIAVPGADSQKITSLCEAFLAELKQTYDEPKATLSVEVVGAHDGEAYTAESTDKMLAILEALPNGVLSWSPDFENLPQTSLNLGVTDTKETFYLHFALRSSVNQERQKLQDSLKAIAAEHGCSYSESGIYSAWEYRKDSPLRDTMTRIYKEQFGKSPTVQVIHAGLECGVLSEKLPGLDCVSTGPNGLDLHTNREKLDIASVGRVWKFLLELLKNL